MTSGFQALMGGLIDYAGLFPPAELPLDSAIRNYARYRREPDAWMLGRFIIPARKLPELEPYLAELFSTGEPPTLSVLGRGGATAAEFFTGLAADLAAITEFRARQVTRARIEVFETRLPFDVLKLRDAGAWRALLAETADRLGGCACGPLVPYYELMLDNEWRASLSVFLPTLAEVNTARTGPTASAGLKLRCGGVEAPAFPAAESVAVVIAQCRANGVALKCTAGLHHPLRHHNDGVKTHMHGFINVFGAGLLAYVHALDAAAIEPILLEQSAAAFTLDDNGLRWQSLAASVEQIAAARQQVTSFGSCSFDEPREDLRALGWLK
jgi:hypothetical protein